MEKFVMECVIPGIVALVLALVGIKLISRWTKDDRSDW